MLKSTRESCRSQLIIYDKSALLDGCEAKASYLRAACKAAVSRFWNTHGSMLTGVASLIADRTGGVMSQLSEGAAKPHSVIDANNIQIHFP